MSKATILPTTVLLLTVVLALLPDQASAGEDEPKIRIYGLVKNPVNVTYGYFKGLPLVTEEVTCICVGWPPEDVGVNAYDVYTYNWTGSPVSALLKLAGVKAGAVDVVFYASDGYSSSLPLERALEPDVIIAVEADGEPLTRGTGYPFRLVVPCWWGYKWVKYVESIEVVDYDHKGTWEGRGYPDIAEVPECTSEAPDEGGMKIYSLPLALGGLTLLGAGIYLAYARRKG